MKNHKHAQSKQWKCGVMTVVLLINTVAVVKIKGTTKNSTCGWCGDAISVFGKTYP